MRNDRVQPAPATGGHSWSFAWLPLLAVALLIAAPPSVSAQEVDMKEVEKAVLQEKWEEVANLLKDVSSDPEKCPNPVLRLIKGHACLALNRNNESVCLFLSVRSEDEQGQWQKWAKQLAAKHPDRAIVHYLQGDAAARRNDWPSAITHYGNALKLNDAHVLVLNARGVVYAHQEELTKARADFAYAVINTDSRLADAYANIGALRIQKKSGLKGALEAFDQATEISPQFVLALHGRACVKAANSLENTDAQKKKLAAALQDCPSALLKKLLLANEERILAFWDGRESTYFLAMLGSGNAAGTTIDSNVSDPFEAFKNDVDNGSGWFETQRNQHHFNGGFNEWKTMAEADQHATMDNLHNWAGDDPARMAAVERASGEIDAWNGPEGGANAWTDAEQLFGEAAAIPTDGVSLLVTGHGMVQGHITDSNHEHIHDFNEMWSSNDDMFNGGTGTPVPMPAPPGGVDMNLADVHRGPSMWPFVGYYALAYDMKKFQTPFGYVQREDTPAAIDAAGTAP